MTNNELFERLYNELEDLVREKYHLSSTASAVYVYETKVKSDVARNLRTLRELRNYLVHDKRTSVIDAFVVTDDAIEYLKKRIEILRQPLRAIDVCVPKHHILFGYESSRLLPLLDQMVKRNISHVPVLDLSDRLMGIFSGESLFQTLIEAGSKAIDAKTMLSDIAGFLAIDKHVGEQYLFVGRNALLEDLDDLVQSTHQTTKKLTMLLVTETGKPNEKILGLITPLDLLAEQAKLF